MTSRGPSERAVEAGLRAALHKAVEWAAGYPLGGDMDRTVALEVYHVGSEALAMSVDFPAASEGPREPRIEAAAQAIHAEMVRPHGGAPLWADLSVESKNTMRRYGRAALAVERPAAQTGEEVSPQNISPNTGRGDLSVVSGSLRGSDAASPAAPEGPWRVVNQGSDKSPDWNIVRDQTPACWCPAHANNTEREARAVRDALNRLAQEESK